MAIPNINAAAQAKAAAYEKEFKRLKAIVDAKKAAAQASYTSTTSGGGVNQTYGTVSGPSPADLAAKQAADKAFADKLAAEQAAGEKAKAAEQARLAEQAAAQKAATEKLAAEKAAQAEQLRLKALSDEQARLAEVARQTELKKQADIKAIADKKLADEEAARAASAARITVPFQTTAPTAVVADPAFVKMQQDNLDLQKQFAAAIATQNANQTYNQKATETALAGQQKALTGMSTDFAKALATQADSSTTALAGQQKAVATMAEGFSKALADSNTATATQMSALGKTTEEISATMANQNAASVKQMSEMGKTTAEISKTLAESNTAVAKQMNDLGKTTTEISKTLADSNASVTKQFIEMGKTTTDISLALANSNAAVTKQFTDLGKTTADISQSLAESNVAVAKQMSELGKSTAEVSQALANSNTATAKQFTELGKSTADLALALSDSNVAVAKQMGELGKTTNDIALTVKQSNAAVADQMAVMNQASEAIAATLQTSTDAITAQMTAMGKTDAEITKTLAMASDQLSAMGLNNKEMAAQIAANAVKAESDLKQAFIDQAAQAKAEQAAAKAEMDKQAAIATGKSFTAARESNKKSFEQAIAAQRSGAAGSANLNDAYTAQENIGMLGAQQNQADKAILAQQATTAAGGMADIGSALSGIDQSLGQTVTNVGTQASIGTANTRMQALSLSSQDQVNKIATSLTSQGMAASDALAKAIDEYGAQVSSRINEANLRTNEGQALLRDYLTSVGLDNASAQQYMNRVLAGELSMADLKVALARSSNTQLATATGAKIAGMQKDAQTDAAWQAAIGAGITAGVGALATSDRRAKKDIKEGGGRSFLDALTAYSYKYNDKSPKDNDGKENVGVMAQDMQKIRPELVKEVDGVKTIDYGKGFNSLLASMVEINDSVKQLENMFKKKKA